MLGLTILALYLLWAVTFGEWPGQAKLLIDMVLAMIGLALLFDHVQH